MRGGHGSCEEPSMSSGCGIHPARCISAAATELDVNLLHLLKALHLICAFVFLSGTLVILALLWQQRDSELEPSEQYSDVLSASVGWNRWIVGPALMGVWIFGLVLAAKSGWFGAMWLNFKLVLVVGMSGVHGVVSARLRKAVTAEITNQNRFAAWASLTLGIALVCVVLLAVVKP